MEVYEIVLGLTAVAAALAGAWYEWRQGREALKEMLQYKHELALEMKDFQLSVDSMSSELESLSARIERIEGVLDASLSPTRRKAPAK